MRTSSLSDGADSMVAGPNEQMGRGQETFALHDQLSTVGRVLMFKYITAFLLLTAPVAWAQGKNDKEEVTTEDVKQFLDPTVMINSLDYTCSLPISYLPVFRCTRTGSHRSGQ
jgi:hypothetical protein